MGREKEAGYVKLSLDTDMTRLHLTQSTVREIERKREGERGRQREKERVREREREEGTTTAANRHRTQLLCLECYSDLQRGEPGEPCSFGKGSL